MKYFFRDLDNQSNFSDGKTYHSSGIAELYSKIGSPANSGKDVSVLYLDPFTGEVRYTWRAFHEIELFEANDFEHERMKKTFDILSNIEI